MDTAFFGDWRDEIAAELAVAQTELADATEALRAAELARDLAHVRPLFLRSRIAALRQPISRAVAARLSPIDREVRDADNGAVQAAGRVASARERLADLQQAAAEIAQLMAPAAADAETEMADASV